MFMTIILCGLGLVFLYAAKNALITKIKFKKDGIKTQGTVVDFREKDGKVTRQKQVTNDDGETVTESYSVFVPMVAANIRYKTTTGKTLMFNESGFQEHHEYKVGDTVALSYLKSNPSEVDFSRNVSWLAPLILLTIASLFIYAGLPSSLFL